MSKIAIKCPRCQAEASFEKGFVFLQGEEAKHAKNNPALTGVQQGGGFVVARYPKIWRGNIRQTVGTISPGATVRVVVFLTNTSLGNM